MAFNRWVSEPDYRDIDLRIYLVRNVSLVAAKIKNPTAMRWALGQV